MNFRIKFCLPCLSVAAIFLMTLIIPKTSFAFFTDVPTTHPYYESIKALDEAHIVKGFSDGTFKPDQLVKRDAFLTMVFRHIGFQPKTEQISTPFVDVPAQSWFAPYVKKALDLGALNTNSLTPRFFPDQPLTKIEALKIMMPLEGIPAPYINDQSPLIFKDVHADASYSYLARAAQKSGLFLFNKEKNFYPFKNLTRGELAQLLYQAQLYRENQGAFEGIILENDVNLTSGQKSIINSPKFPLLMDIWNEVNQEYYNPADINQDQLIYGAASGMVDTLNDPYSVFLNPEKAAQLESALDGQFEGIGVAIEVVNGQPTIAEIIPGSPAEKAGLKSGDLFMTIDGKDVSHVTLEQLTDLIQGPADTEVALTMKRDQQVLIFKIKREIIQIDSVQKLTNAVKVPDDIGYITIFQFYETTDKEFTNVWQKVLEKKPKGLILDLRNNGGGYLDSALGVLDQFVPKDQTLVNFKLNGKFFQEKSKGPGDIHIPVVVLINGNTASASEIVAGALQDLKIAKLIGEQSFGKGVAQKIITYSDGSILKLTFENWLTPLMHDINKVGLKPDIQVARTKDDIKNGNDPQLQRAIEELEK